MVHLQIWNISLKQYSSHHGALTHETQSSLMWFAAIIYF